MGWKERVVPYRPTLIRSCARAVLAIALMAAAPSGEASAQGLFNFLFGGPSRPPAPLPPQTNAYTNPFGSPEPGQPSPTPSVGTGRTTTYCVRLCDGRYFPVQRYAGSTPVQLCNALCPASRTVVFSGGEINNAVAQNGARYADLDNAFVYREKIVPDCTCNGRDPFGTARVDITSDPTLRPGDIVATTEGMKAFTGGRRPGREMADFTPIQSYPGIGADIRQKLGTTTVAPAN